MKVCFFSHSAGQNGAERSLIELITGLQIIGVECHVFLPKRGPLHKRLSELKIPFQIFFYPRWMRREGESGILGRIVRTVLSMICSLFLAFIMARKRYDIVYTNTSTICIGALTARILRLPHIWHIREFGYADQRLVFDIGTKVSGMIMNKFTSVCVTNSYAVSAAYKNVFPENKIRTVYNPVVISGVDIAQDRTALRRSGEVLNCIVVGALNKHKGQDDAIMAVAKLKQIGIGVQLVIVGDSKKKQYKDYLNSLVINNDVSDRVIFTGHIDNPYPLINSSDLLLVCSRSEAFGRTTVEGMLLKKPVIGTDSGGTVELIREGLNGFRYAFGDSNDLASKLKILYDDPIVSREIGGNGYNWAKDRFTVDMHVSKIFSILNEVVTGKH